MEQQNMFELSDVDRLVSQIVIPSKSYFGRATPFTFTKQGVPKQLFVNRNEIAGKVKMDY